VSKPNIAAAIAMGRTPVRRASVSAEEEALASASQVEAVVIADSNVDILSRPDPTPAAWADAAIIREAWEATKPGAIGEKKKPGPQRRTGTFLKRIFTLDRDTSDRTRDGRLVDSMSEFVAAVLAEHRDKHSH
jgi:hypothetical protein